jgi:hypothetical protein
MRIYKLQFTKKIALLTMVVAATAEVRAAELIDRVMAVAGGSIIMLSDVAAARDLGLVPPAASGDPIAAALSTLVDRALVLVEVDRYGPPEPSAAAIDAEFRTVRARFASQPAFDATLRKSGLDDKTLRARLRDDLRIRAYEDQRFNATTEDRRKALVDDWIAGLRRRTNVTMLYLPSR